jgi:hypothetical protein
MNTNEQITAPKAQDKIIAQGNALGYESQRLNKP